MHYGQIFTADCANGEGMRISLFVSGCTNRCEGCFQPQTWDFSYGKPYTAETEEFILQELERPYYDGLTILGGEPFELENQKELVPLVKKVKETLPEKTIWMYTGNVYDTDLVPGGRRYGEHTDDILDRIDVLVDGRFEMDKKNIRLKFRGSENQRIIDMKKTRESGCVVLHPLNESC